MGWRKEPGYRNLHTLADAAGRELADIQGQQGAWRYRLRSDLGVWSEPFRTVPAAKQAAEAGLSQARPASPAYPCTACSGDAYIGYAAGPGQDWNSLVAPGERLCTGCFPRRGGADVFARSRESNGQ